MSPRIRSIKLTSGSRMAIPSQPMKALTFFSLSNSRGRLRLGMGALSASGFPRLSTTAPPQLLKRMSVIRTSFYRYAHSAKRLALLPIDLSQNDIDASDRGDRIRNQTSLDHLWKGAQIEERGRPNSHP